MKYVLISVITALLLTFIQLIVTPPQTVMAQEAAPTTYSVQYDFDFYPKLQSKAVETQLTITLTNLRSDVYINEYSIRFPKNILFKNLRVSNDNGTIPYVVSDRINSRQITFKFPEPETGRNSQNIIKLTYTLDDMVNSEGSVDEMILPLLVTADKGAINATLHLPDNFESTITIAKPRPTTLDFKTVRWESIEAETLYVLFGESQMYNLDLSYSVSNNSITSKKQTIALPPETLYQKIYIGSIEPKPDRTFTDEDGNFLAEYTVGPRGKIDINFKGYAEVFVKPQSTLREPLNRLYTEQKSYLLTEKKLWSLGKKIHEIPFDNMKNILDIYRYTVDTLEYSPQRLNESPKRLGATDSLVKPTNALCTEFTDLFVALAREKGIPSREIEGYGFSDSESLRPQSFASDILHSWPEYYNTQQETWYQVDPTWEDTSGIDYFSSFDVNHIALVIHGKDPESPLPAGFYKTTPKKDVHVSVSTKRPNTVSKLTIDHTIEKNLVAGNDYQGVVIVTNLGNTFIHQTHILPQSKTIIFNPTSIPVSYLAPFESREIPVSYHVTEDYSPEDTVSFSYDGQVLGSQAVRIRPKSSFDMMLVISSAIGILILLSILFIIRSNKR